MNRWVWKHARQSCGDQTATFRARGTGTIYFLVTVVILLAFPFILFGSAGAMEKGSATDAVRKTVDHIMQILSDETLKPPDRAQERRELVKAAVNQLVNYEEMGKRALGRQWKTLSAEERQEFVRLFRQFLSNSYEGKFQEYSGEKVRYLRERLKGNFAEVRTKLISSKLEVPMDFRLLWQTGQWWVYDIVVDGVSLVNNYRAQFRRIIRHSSYQELLKKLKSKVDINAGLIRAK